MHSGDHQMLVSVISFDCCDKLFYYLFSSKENTLSNDYALFSLENEILHLCAHA